MWDRYI